jgi:uncharacterized delta-60 repeat protein
MTRLHLTPLETRDTPTSLVPPILPQEPTRLVASAVAPDGGAVLVGVTENGGMPTVVRLAPGSRLDTRFDGDGIKDIHLLGAGDRNNSLSLAIVRAVAVQADGKVVLAGTARAGTFDSNDFLVVRLNLDGSLDQSFGTGGVATVGFDPPGGPGGVAGDEATALAVAADGSVVVAGVIGAYPVFGPQPIEGDYTAVGVARLTAAGELDATFDGDGRATILNVDGAARQFALSAADVAVGPNGTVVVLGNQFRYGLPPIPTPGGPAPESPEPFLARFTAGGQLDAGFGAGGLVRGVGQDGYDWGSARSVAVGADGTVYTLTLGSDSATNSFAVPAVSRYTAAGGLDPTFGTGGVAAAAAPGKSYSYEQDMAVTADGRAYVVAPTDAAGEPAQSPSATTVTRLGPTGATEGRYVLPAGGAGRADLGHTIGAAADGKLVVAGRVLLAGPTLAVFPPPPPVYSEPGGVFAATLDWSAAPAVVSNFTLPHDGDDDTPPAPMPTPVGPTAEAVAAGQPPVVTVKNADGSVRFTLDVFEKTFTGGVGVVVADVNRDGVGDIVASAGDGGGPRIRIFDGVTGAVLADFFAFDDTRRVGVNVAVGPDGTVVAGAGVGGGPRVRTFRPDGTPVLDFFAYDAKARGGVSVAAGDVTGDGVTDVVTGSGPGGGPHVKVFDGATGREVMAVLAGDPGDRGGATVRVGRYGPMVTATTAGGVRWFDALTGTDLTPVVNPAALSAPYVG